MSDVIDWDEAMQQCGEDEEFLRELLDDLRSETDTQMLKIEETIRVSGRERICLNQAVQFFISRIILNDQVLICLILLCLYSFL